MPGNIASPLHPNLLYVMVFEFCSVAVCSSVYLSFVVVVVGIVLFCFCITVSQRIAWAVVDEITGVQVFLQAKGKQESYLSLSFFLHVENVAKEDNPRGCPEGWECSW